VAHGLAPHGRHCSSQGLSDPARYPMWWICGARCDNQAQSNGTATTSEEASGPAPRKGPRTPPWAFSLGKRPQSAGRCGCRPTPRDRRKPLQIEM